MLGGARKKKGSFCVLVTLILTANWCEAKKKKKTRCSASPTARFAVCGIFGYYGAIGAEEKKKTCCFYHGLLALFVIPLPGQTTTTTKKCC